MGERFERSFERDPASGCWVWLRGKNSAGYGQFCGWGNPGRWMLAHRWSYEFNVGPIPQGLVIDHLCRNPACVNPDHLEAVTQRENSRRGALAHVIKTGTCRRGHASVPGKNCRQCASVCDKARRRKRGLMRKGPKPRSHCVAGHEMSGDNLWVGPMGDRKCRTCNAERHRVRRNNGKTD
jgi:hypothetical protein